MVSGDVVMGIRVARRVRGSDLRYLGSTGGNRSHGVCICSRPRLTHLLDRRRLNERSQVPVFIVSPGTLLGSESSLSCVD